MLYKVHIQINKTLKQVLQKHLVQRTVFKGVDLGYPKIFPSFNFFFNLHHGIVMSKYIICQNFKFHRAVFSIAHPKYSNFGGILDARW